MVRVVRPNGNSSIKEALKRLHLLTWVLKDPFGMTWIKRNYNLNFYLLCLGVSGYDYYSQQTQVGAGGGVTSRGNTTTASTSGNHHQHHPHLGPPPQQPPGGGGGGYQARAATGYHGNGTSQAPLHPPLPPPPPAPAGPLADNQGIRARSFTRGPPNRFFNDYETQFVVKVGFSTSVIDIFTDLN